MSWSPEVEIMRVIRVRVTRGKGVKDDPIRPVDFYFQLTEDTTRLFAVKDELSDESVAK